MATQAIAGKGGVISSTGTPGDVGDEVGEWEATVESDLLDATSFDSLGFREFIEGLATCTGTFTAMGTPPVQGAVTDLTLQVGTTTGDLVISGAAIINSVAHSTPVDGKVEYSGSVSYTGTFVLSTVV